MTTQHIAHTTHPTAHAAEQAAEARCLARAAGVLAKAARLVAQFGLFREAYWPGARSGHPYISGDPCCTLGALAVAAGIYHADQVDDAIGQHRALELATDQLGAVLAERDPDFCQVWGWNDSPERTQGEVIAALRAAADRTATEADALAALSLSGVPSATVSHQAGTSTSSTREHITSEEVPADE